LALLEVIMIIPSKSNVSSLWMELTFLSKDSISADRFPT